MILERTAYKMDAVCKQGGGEGVALVTVQFLTVKGEGQWCIAVNTAAFFGTEWLAHLPASLAIASRSGMVSPAL